MEQKNVRRTGLVADDQYRDHHTGIGHPECPDRYDAVLSALAERGLDRKLEKLDVQVAPTDTVVLAHDRSYILQAEEDIRAGSSMLRTGDTMVSRQSFDVALKAAGGVIAAVDAVVSGAVKNAFCAVRPPGHHATRRLGMGFCVINNVAVAARYAQSKHKLEKVLIVDWDVHHGNGTQDIFYQDGSVFYFSTHQYPWYPGTGARQERGSGDGEDTTLNCPLPAGTGGPDIIRAFEEDLLPAADAFKPDLVLLSAGFDSRRGDPLGHFLLDDEDFGTLTSIMMDIAQRHARGRLVSTLEGGYHLAGLGKAAAEHVSVLAGPAAE